MVLHLINTLSLWVCVCQLCIMSIFGLLFSSNRCVWKFCSLYLIILIFFPFFSGGRRIQRWLQFSCWSWVCLWKSFNLKSLLNWVNAWARCNFKFSLSFTWGYETKQKETLCTLSNDSYHAHSQNSYYKFSNIQ